MAPLSWSCQIIRLAPEPSPRRDFISRALSGVMTPEDQAYMGRAILQMSDEIAEMRERIKALEMVVGRQCETPPD